MRGPERVSRPSAGRVLKRGAGMSGLSGRPLPDAGCGGDAELRVGASPAFASLSRRSWIVVLAWRTRGYGATVRA